MELETTVTQLRLQILQLEAQRHALTLRINTSNPATRVAMEYCRLFSRGLARDDNEPPRRSNLPTHDQQTRFITATFHHNARIGGSYGCDELLKQAGFFTTFYGGLHLTPQCYAVVSTQSPHAAVKANVLLEVTVTQSTLRYVYPHLVDPKYDDITRKLLGRRLKCSANMEFVFDKEENVESFDWAIDFVSAFLQVLTVEQIVVVPQHELIVRDTYLLAKADPFEPVDDTVDLLFEEKIPLTRRGHIHDGKRDDFAMV